MNNEQLARKRSRFGASQLHDTRFLPPGDRSRKQLKVVFIDSKGFTCHLSAQKREATKRSRPQRRRRPAHLDVGRSLAVQVLSQVRTIMFRPTATAEVHRVR